MAIAAGLAPQPILQFFDNNSAELSGGLLFTYAAGTTTKQTTYTDASGQTPNTNPVVLDSRGEAQVWLTPNVAYKFVLSPSTDTDPPTNPFWTVNDIAGATNGALSPAFESANFNAVAGGAYWVHTAIGAITATLPATPNQNDQIVIVDIDGDAATSPITLNLNGGQFQGNSANPTIAIGYGMLKIQFTGTQWVQMP